MEHRAGRRHLGKVLDAAEAAAGASAHRPAARKMRLQSFAGQRDLELPAVLDELNLDASNIVDIPGDLLGQYKAVSEILEVPRRGHHDREGRAAYDDLNGGLDRNRSG